MSDFFQLKQVCCDANRQLAQTGLIDLTFGNLSYFDPALQAFAIKPSGVDYDQLTPDHMVVVDMQGHVVDGDLKPSSDTPTHCRLFQAFASKGMRSVVHTHSRHAVSFAQAAKEIPAFGTTHCDYFNGAIPVTRELTPDEVESFYEWETGNVIVERFDQINPVEIPAILVRNHGPFAWGPTPQKAIENAYALEICAQMAFQTLLIHHNAPAAPEHLRRKHFDRKHGINAYYGQK